jgi:hypothetical protein
VLFLNLFHCSRSIGPERGGVFCARTQVPSTSRPCRSCAC